MLPALISTAEADNHRTWFQRIMLKGCSSRICKCAVLYRIDNKILILKLLWLLCTWVIQLSAKDTTCFWYYPVRHPRANGRLRMMPVSEETTTTQLEFLGHRLILNQDQNEALEMKNQQTPPKCDLKLNLHTFGSLRLFKVSWTFLSRTKFCLKKNKTRKVVHSLALKIFS